MASTDIFFRRLAFTKLVFLLAVVVLIWRLFQLQVINHSWYEELASDQHSVLASLTPARGSIYLQDRYSPAQEVVAAANKELFLVYAVPKDIVDPATTAEKLSPLLNRETAELQSLLNKPGDPYEPLVHFVEEAVVQKVNDLKLKGIFSLPEEKRYYPTIPNYLGQVLGFVGFSGEERLGQYGIEGYWNKELAGQMGKLQAEKDVAGGLITLGKSDITPAKEGSNIYLTIDYNIQTKACGELDKSVKQHGADGGSLLVLDPTTGAILALCNTPNFDPNTYNVVTNNKIFIDSAVSDSYEPGSVFKPITMAAALASGKVTPDTTYEDTGEVVFGKDIIKNSDEKSNGRQTMTQVLEKSLNTGVIYAMRRAGAQNFRDMIAKFGFGEVTGIELPTESTGNIKSLNNREEIYLATASFGQGISVTPLQLITAYGAIANKGKLMKPYIVRKVIAPDGTIQEPKPVMVRQVLDSTVATTLAGMMVTVVETGHGKRAAVPGYYVAGKTGTAQVSLPGKLGYDPHKTIGSFAGFAPVNNPRFVMLVKIDNPKDVVFAESTAAPVFGEVAKFLLDYYQVPPERNVNK